VLLVEDEFLIRLNTAETLADLGCDVTDVGSAEEALGHLQASRFDMLVTDVGLGGMDGAALAEQARGIDPTLRIVFATGQNDAPDIPGLRTELLAKPFDDKAITRLLRRAGPAGGD
jgi:CheY-like chemotaxis protein